MTPEEKDAFILDLTKKCVDETNQGGLTLRIMGATAIRYHCGRWAALHSQFRHLSDLDFATYWDDITDIERRMTEMGFERRQMGLSPELFARRRVFYFAANGEKLTTDIFLDKLEMNHAIDFKGRLGADYPTIPLAELFLEKMQIVNINEKDLKDTLVLLLEHGVGNTDKEEINAGFIAERLSKDWGFHYTVQMNLDKVVKATGNYSNAFTADQLRLIEERANELKERFESVDKSLGWKVRAKVGTKKMWYNPVEEMERAPFTVES